MSKSVTGTDIAPEVSATKSNMMPILIGIGLLLLGLAIVFMVRLWFKSSDSKGKPNGAQNAPRQRPPFIPPNDGLEAANCSAVKQMISSTPNKPGAIMVYAAGCIHCKNLRTTFKAIQDKHSSFKMLTVNMQNADSFIKEYKPHGYPLILYHSGGQIRHTALGNQPMSAIEQEIQKAVADAPNGNDDKSEKSKDSIPVIKSETEENTQTGSNAEQTQTENQEQAVSAQPVAEIPAKPVDEVLAQPVAVPAQPVEVPAQPVAVPAQPAQAQLVEVPAQPVAVPAQPAQAQPVAVPAQPAQAQPVAVPAQPAQAQPI